MFFQTLYGNPGDDKPVGTTMSILLNKCKKAILYMIIVLAAIIVLWQLSITLLHIDITIHNVNLHGLPTKLDGLRIVQLSDPHLGPFVPERLIRKAVDAANSCDADYIVVTGDYVSVSTRYADKCMEILSKLKPKRGVYMVAGNHDYSLGITAICDAATKHGLRLWTNNSEEVLPGLYIAGVDDESDGNADVQAAFKNIPEDKAIVMITHEPSTADLVKKRDVLVLTGHTHGGQIGIPIVTRKFMAKYFGFRSGWYQFVKAKLYVNRGIGFNGMIPARFRCNPEVSVFILHPANHQKVGTTSKP